MKDRISIEFHRLLNNQCSEVEFEAFLNKIEEDRHREIYAQLIEDTLSKDVVPEQLNEQVQERLNRRLEQILAGGSRAGSLKIHRKYPLYKYAAAASVLLMTAVALLFFFSKKRSESVHPLASTVIAPGGNKATLTLSDGRQLLLNDLKNGSLAEESGITILKNKDGELIYQSRNDARADQVAEPGKPQKYNVLETPRGGQYQLILPDGTKVWLNAASTLKFPASFAQLENRMVELQGEAYFEVAKDKFKPFIVNASATADLEERVEVLGTHFNISSYTDELNLKTTLLEGSVRIENQLLIPGQQSERNVRGLKVRKIDVEDAIAWKNGFFVFENDNLDGILKKLSRWYDVEFVYDKALNKVKLIGAVSRDTNLDGVLRMLEKTDKFKFKLQGRRILVMP